MTGIDIASCIALARDKAPSASSQCPGYLEGQLAFALEECTRVGGQLRPSGTPAIWSLDVNRDGKPEFAFEPGGVVECDGAASIFSCGSLGCPLALYEERAGGWQAIAGIYADAPESIEVLGVAAGRSYRKLRVGCIDGPPCDEYSYYVWSGQQYERKYLEVRGFRVDFAGSVHGLHGLRGPTAVLATPEPGGRAVGHYGPDTEVAIIGTAESAAYYYVSPCNACESGFVPKTAVLMPVPMP